MNREAIVSEARSWIGTPYVHQASCKGAGADCLGLIRGLWRLAYGDEPVRIPAYTPDWSEPAGEESLLATARELLTELPREIAGPGDVVLFRMRPGTIAKHMGLLAAPGPRPTFIHAYSGYGVVESPLSEPWQRRIAGFFRFPEEV